MTITFILSVLFIHWIADFVCQTHMQARNKGISMTALIEHTFTYTCLWIVPLIIYGMINNINPNLMWFLPITFCAHTITDYYTSRVNSKLFVDGIRTNDMNLHNFFVSIGFDQWLHYAQIFITLKWLLG